MRAWLDPQKLASLDLTASEVMHAIEEQNVDVAAGNIGQQPVPKGQVYQLVLNTQGRLTTPDAKRRSKPRRRSPKSADRSKSEARGKWPR